MAKMMVCERCGKNTYIIFITKNHEKICDECEEKERNKITCHKINGKKCKKVIDDMMKRRL